MSTEVWTLKSIRDLISSEYYHNNLSRLDSVLHKAQEQIKLKIKEATRNKLEFLLQSAYQKYKVDKFISKDELINLLKEKEKEISKLKQGIRHTTSHEKMVSKVYIKWIFENGQLKTTSDESIFVYLSDESKYDTLLKEYEELKKMYNLIKELKEFKKKYKILLFKKATFERVLYFLIIIQKNPQYLSDEKLNESPDDKETEVFEKFRKEELLSIEEQKKDLLNRTSSEYLEELKQGLESRTLKVQSLSNEELLKLLVIKIYDICDYFFEFEEYFNQRQVETKKDITLSDIKYVLIHILNFLLLPQAEPSAGGKKRITKKSRKNKRKTTKRKQPKTYR